MVCKRQANTSAGLRSTLEGEVGRRLPFPVVWGIDSKFGRFIVAIRAKVEICWLF